MFLLADSIRDTCSIVDGWTTGRLVIEDGVFIQIKDGRLVPVPEGSELQVWCHNSQRWYQLKEQDLARCTEQGWPLFASMDARMK